VERLCQRNVTTICQWRDYKTRRITQVLVRVQELGVANVDIGVAVDIAPACAQLRLPRKGTSRIGLHQNHFEHDITSVHVNGTNGHNLLTIALWQVAEQKGDEIVELSNLLLRVVLHRALVAFFQPRENDANLGGPPNLRCGERYLSGIIKEPLLTRFLLVRDDRVGHVGADGGAHRVHDAIEPHLDLPVAVALVLELDILALGGVHAESDLRVLLELQVSRVVEELGEMGGDDDGVVAIGQNVQQVSRRDKVEPGEGQSFCFEILSKGLLTQRQPILHWLEGFKQAGLVGCFDHIWHVGGLVHNSLEVGVNAIKSFRILGQLLSNILGSDKDGLQVTPRSLHF